jgi:hypothetical protein
MRLLALIAVAVLLWLFLVRGKSRGGNATAAIKAGNSFLGGGVSGAFASDPDLASHDAFDNFLHAIFQFEGGRPGDRNVRNNNPGNLRSGPGMTGKAGGYATFADQGDGWDALTDLVNRRTSQHPDWDFYDFFNYYLRSSTTAPSVDAQGNSDAYAEYVANYVGVDPTETVASVIGGN